MSAESDQAKRLGEALRAMREQAKQQAERQAQFEAAWAELGDKLRSEMPEQEPEQPKRFAGPGGRFRLPPCKPLPVVHVDCGERLSAPAGAYIRIELGIEGSDPEPDVVIER